MQALVVYESMFGNTRTLARAVADGLLAAGAQVTVSPVDEVDPTTLTEYDVVVAGAPTHALSLPRPSTREDAARQGAPTPPETGLREWLGQLEPTVGARPRFAVFDTRIGTGVARHFTGSAARRTARTLRGLHRTLADDPMSFYVEATTGPLAAGEEIRARAWGGRLARTAPVG
ncbi:MULTISPECIES: flavodoxin family protein [unclassified Nocardioides]|uniref:flavodoxin family protein n=1 Tax=unclassified Nocardioides TaxID=2615069 RepID=UPI0036060807